MYTAILNSFGIQTRKQAAMEQYNLKRMRRKFKAMQDHIDGQSSPNRSIDWKTLYQESRELRGGGENAEVQEVDENDLEEEHTLKVADNALFQDDRTIILSSKMGFSNGEVVLVQGQRSPQKIVRYVFSYDSIIDPQTVLLSEVIRKSLQVEIGDWVKVSSPASLVTESKEIAFLALNDDINHGILTDSTNTPEYLQNSLLKPFLNQTYYPLHLGETLLVFGDKGNPSPFKFKIVDMSPESYGICAPTTRIQCFTTQQQVDDYRYLKNALAQGKKEWRRSKIMIVGEGRAGKTALANSILGRPYENLDSTIGINEFTCNVGYANVGNVAWQGLNDHKQAKEFELALASIMLDSKTGKIVDKENAMEIDIDKLAQTGRGGYQDWEDVAGDPKLSEVEDLKLEKDLPRGNAFNVVRSREANPIIPNDLNLGENNIQAESEDVEKEIHLTEEPSRDIDTSLVMKYLGEKSQVDSKFILSVFDFGGQSVFNVIHPFFLTRFGVYVVVFNMEWLSSKADGKTKEDCIQYLSFWINSIIIHTQNEKGEIAPLLFVGTRKDLIQTPAEHQAISTYLHNVFSNSLAWPYLLENIGAEGSNGKCDLCFFPVNNKLGAEDETIKKVLTVIEDTIDKAVYVHLERPLNWFQVLDSFKSRNLPYLKYSEVERIGLTCGIPPDQIGTLLRFFHEMGILMWHDEATLRDIVVFDPIEYFVKPATIVICKHLPNQEDGIYHSTEHHRRIKKTLPKEFREMTHHGIVSESLLKALLEEHKSNYNFIRQLMLKYGLLVPLFLDKEEGEGEVVDGKSPIQISENLYLVPALFPEAEKFSNLLFQPFQNTDRSRIFSFIFTPTSDISQMSTITLDDCNKLGFLPSGLFEKLIAKSLAWSMKTSDFMARNSLYRCNKNYSELAFGNQRFQIMADYYHNVITVQLVDGINPFGVYDRLKEQIQEVIEESMKSLKFISALRYQASHDSSSENILFLGLNQIRQLVERTSALSLNLPGGRSLLSSSEALVSYAPWLTEFVTFDEYDMFISYRWGRHDSSFVKGLFDRISLFSVDATMRPARVFLDVKRLKSGENFLNRIGKALNRTLLMIPIVSTDALQKMKSLRPEEEDNLLIEWICGLEMAESQLKKDNQPQEMNSSVRLMKFMPIFFGTRSANANDLQEGMVGNLFQENVIQDLPEVIPKACLNTARILLKQMGIQMSSARSESTIRDIVREVTKYLFLCAWESKNSHELTLRAAKSVITSLNECLQSLSPDHPAHSVVVNQHSESTLKSSSSTVEIKEIKKDEGNNALSLNDLKQIMKREFGITKDNLQEVIEEAILNLSKEEQEICNNIKNTRDKATKIVEIIKCL